MRLKEIAAMALLAPGLVLASTDAATRTGHEPAIQASGVARSPLTGARLAGSARLRYWGLDVYHASLWVRPGFAAPDFASHAFALELDYLRDFTSAAIASRSVDEMRRLDSFSEAQARTWQAALRRVLPDVKKGDRIAGLHLPGVGARFLVNSQPAGEILDPAFARLFFGIWLSPATSEPQLRQALLAQVQP
jgi:hypothetical protein